MGIFRQAFRKDDMDWENPATYATPFPRTDGSEFVDSCLDAWTDSLCLLKLDRASLAWPLLKGELKAKVKLKCPASACNDVLAKDLPQLNFLEKHSVFKAIEHRISDDKQWRIDAHLVRKRRF
jgi:hypothetical protein